MIGAMKTLSLLGRTAGCLIACVAVGLISAHAASSSFETTDGSYVNGASIQGKTDTSIGSAWTNVGNANSSTANVYDGSLAIRVTDTSTTNSSGATTAWTNADSLLLSPFTFKFSMAVGADVSDGTGNQVQVYLGQPVAGDANNWTKVVYDDSAVDGVRNGVLRISTGTGAANSDYGVNLGLYTAYSAFGEYVTISITIDPTTMKYTSVTVDGTLTANPVDLTTTVQASNGGTVPWTSTLGTPSDQMLIVTGGNDTGTFDFDAFSITSAVPEPGTWAMVVLAMILLPLLRRRRASCE